MIAFSDVMNKQDDVADCENGDYDGHNVDEKYDGDNNDGDDDGDDNDDENDNGDDDDDAWAGMIIRRVQFWGRAAISPPSPPTQLLSICLPTIIIIIPILIIAILSTQQTVFEWDQVKPGYLTQAASTLLIYSRSSITGCIQWSTHHRYPTLTQVPPQLLMAASKFSKRDCKQSNFREKPHLAV